MSKLYDEIVNAFSYEESSEAKAQREKEKQEFEQGCKDLIEALKVMGRRTKPATVKD